MIEEVKELSMVGAAAATSPAGPCQGGGQQVSNNTLTHIDVAVPAFHM